MNILKYLEIFKENLPLESYCFLEEYYKRQRTEFVFKSIKELDEYLLSLLIKYQDQSDLKLYKSLTNFHNVIYFLIAFEINKLDYKTIVNSYISLNSDKKNILLEYLYINNNIITDEELIMLKKMKITKFDTLLFMENLSKKIEEINF